MPISSKSMRLSLPNHDPVSRSLLDCFSKCGFCCQHTFAAFFLAALTESGTFESLFQNDSISRLYVDSVVAISNSSF